MDKLNKPKLTFEQLKKALNDLYTKQDDLEREVRLKLAEYEQLKEDIELMQLMIMHQSNKLERVQNV